MQLRPSRESTVPGQNRFVLAAKGDIVYGQKVFAYSPTVQVRPLYFLKPTPLGDRSERAKER